MDFKKIEKLFNNKINNVEIGMNDIHLFTEDEIEKAQIGYRCDENGKINENWIGNEYIVIGYESCCGDPIIAKIDDNKFPIYSMFHDDWNTLEKIADNFEQYISLLKEISELDLSNKNDCDEFLKKIKMDISENEYYYWEQLITLAYEFLTDSQN